LGRVEPCKVEVKETVQGKEKQLEEAQIWAVYNSETNRWLRRVLNDAYWQPENAERSGFGSKEIAEGNIKWLHENGTLRARIEHCKAVLIAPKKSERGEEKQPKTDQPSPEKDGEKQRVKQQFYLIQMNPKSAERFNAFYLEKLSTDGFATHTPNPNEAMHLIDADAAQTEIDTIIKYGAGRYDADDFKIVEKP
jgi:hypothetical protein